MNRDIGFRERKRDEGEGWELTFADMMTLILCFFVLIVAISSVDMDRYNAISDVMSETMGGKAEQQQQISLAEIMQGLESVISAEPEAVQLEMRQNAIAVNLRDTVFFDIGSAELTEKALSLLNRIREPLSGIPYRITVEGHTDNIPIKSERFPSNWELSGARASAVARNLIDYGFPKDKVQVLGLADTRPLLPNENENGQPIPGNQSLNRRVVILVTP